MNNPKNGETPAIGALPEMCPPDDREERLMKKFIPPALAKACFDPFDYALRLRTGEVIAFESASLIDTQWVHLILKPTSDQPITNRIAFPGERGVDVRISDIVWVMDAPNGS